MATRVEERQREVVRGAGGVGVLMRLSSETKHSFKTTEFWAMVAVIVGILVASKVVGQGDGNGNGGTRFRRCGRGCTSRSSRPATWSAVVWRKLAAATRIGPVPMISQVATPIVRRQSRLCRWSLAATTIDTVNTAAAFAVLASRFTERWSD
jgi:hypothetical protein